MESLIGLAPEFLTRFIPVLSFIIVGAIVAPGRRFTVTAILGLIAAVFDWPFGSRYRLGPEAFPFYETDVLGTLLGAAVGVLLAYSLLRRFRKERPNQSTDPAP